MLLATITASSFEKIRVRVRLRLRLRLRFQVRVRFQVHLLKRDPFLDIEHLIP